MSAQVNLPLPRQSTLSATLRVLPGEHSRVLFTLNVLLERRQKLSGPVYHGLVGELLGGGEICEHSLRSLLHRHFPKLRLSGRDLLAAGEQADQWLNEGNWAASWHVGGDTVSSLSQCPGVVFGRGNIASVPAWVSVFNSRKPRQFSIQEQWLETLRRILPELANREIGMASSVGTVTYDLVTAYAREAGIPSILVLPVALKSHGQEERFPLLAEARSDRCFLSCQFLALSCSRSTRMICRDHLLANLADLPVLLEIRPGGNLARVLAAREASRPCRVSIEGLKTKGKEAAQTCREKSRVAGEAATTSCAPQPLTVTRRNPEDRAVRVLARDDVAWQHYLYHYTRSCPGPWPGQPYKEYLLELCQGNLSAGHRALDTLARLLTEQCIRAGGKLVRGGHPVVSWTARPPSELDEIRRWNAALIRWTFEPYGIAVRKKALKAHGAKPVIYTEDRSHSRLAHADRFRFQRHHPPHCDWKNEREWRLPGDCRLEQLGLEDGFVFVPSLEDADRLARQVELPLPVVVLGFSTSCD
jgi:hypothetical protein